MILFGRGRRRAPVAVLGAGPAGLFAAWAAREAGHDVHIMSQRIRPSEMFGAQYLHAAIPGLTMDPARIEYILKGTPLGYAQKVYGPERGEHMAPVVSPVTLRGVHDAWEIRGAYERAWKAFEGDMSHMMVDETSMSNLLTCGIYGYVISSIPPQAYCRGEGSLHHFHSADIWSKGDAPERGSWCPVSVDPFTVVCNGEKAPGWYRASNIFGYRTAEWPGYRRPPVEGIASVCKPLSTNCNCFGGGRVLRVGRYGTWSKGQLSHSAYYSTKEFLA